MSERMEARVVDGVLLSDGGTGGAACGSFCPPDWKGHWKKWHRQHCGGCSRARQLAFPTREEDDYAGCL